MHKRAHTHTHTEEWMCTTHNSGNDRDDDDIIWHAIQSYDEGTLHNAALDMDAARHKQMNVGR